jgi:hypothetical protein
MTSQSFGFTRQTQPIGQLLRGSPVLSGEGVRLIVRSYFVSSGFTSELVLGMPRADSAPTSKPSRSQGSEFRPVRRFARPLHHGDPASRSDPLVISTSPRVVVVGPVTTNFR